MQNPRRLAVLTALAAFALTGLSHFAGPSAVAEVGAEVGADGLALRGIEGEGDIPPARA